MDIKIQLEHPQGKQAVRMDKAKYELLKGSLLRSLSGDAKLSHTEILNFIKADLVSRGIEFKGSLQWYLQSVKMDLEAKGIILREGRSPETYCLIRTN